MKRKDIPFAFLPVNKPAGPTSHDVVAAVRRCLPRKTKVGHTGTLDPFAEGILILAIGKATRFSDDVHGLSKTYEGTIELGRQTNTLDPTGEVTSEMDVPYLDASIIEPVAAQFRGEIDQVPPAFSAKKVDGVRSYRLARKDKAVVLEAKRVQIEALTIQLIEPRLLRLTVTCSTGTYVRSLARDIAESLGTCGLLASLVRTSVGPVQLNHCVDLAQLSEEGIHQHRLPIGAVLSQYPEIELPADSYQDLVNGRIFPTHEPLPTSFIGRIERHGDVRAMFKCQYQRGVGVSSSFVCYHE
ncbi:MAG: tRNA pseudouridine(55) synthase TruB [Acidobacteria bacterium]|nr:tRNA pseudouridine(55) synthase TruB [Acidobacteriota bacterium]